jgi:hypothetical protein
MYRCERRGRNSFDVREMHSCVHARVTVAVQLAVYAIRDRPQSGARDGRL